MGRKETKSIIEALLYVWGEPLAIKDIASILSIDKKEIDDLLRVMADEFDRDRRGLRITKVGEGYQLSTRSEHHHWISKLFGDTGEKQLSNAALETLSIIAYKQPVTRNEIEGVRGVRCDRVIESLVSRNMVEERGRLDKPGRPKIYGTTDEFLRYFGLESIKDLPEPRELQLNYDNQEE